jgi:flagellar assembly protein FliH
MKALSEAPAPTAPPLAPSTRIIAAEALAQALPFDIDDLSAAQALPERRLTSRDLGNETARAAYAMGRRRGWEQGFRAGHTQGMDEGLGNLAQSQVRTVATLAKDLGRVIESFRAEMGALESQVASDMVSLAIDIAREVLRREPVLGEAALLPAAREALHALGEGASRLEIHLHPEDAAMLVPHLESVHAGKCVVREEAGLPRGACRVEADTGVAEAGFEQRWQAVMATLGRDEEPLP